MQTNQHIYNRVYKKVKNKLDHQNNKFKLTDESKKTKKTRS